MDGILSNTFLLAQIFGFCAFACCMFAYQIKNPRYIVLACIPISWFFGLQFLLLGAYSAAIFSLICMFKDAVIFILRQEYLKRFIYCYLLINTSFLLFYYESIFDLLPILSALFINIPLINRDNRHMIVRGTIVSQICWIIFNLNVSAWFGFACSILTIFSAMIGMARHEKWEVGKCYRSFTPSIVRALLNKTQPAIIKVGS